MADQSEHLDLTSIMSLYDAGLAEVLRIKLEDEGIQCAIEGEHQAGLSGVLPVRILVRSSDVERAKAILEKHRSAGDRED